jgi:hypothetical protein
MNDQMQTLKDDIAFMRALAQEGQQTPPLGGAILALAGGVFGLASIAQWAVLSGVLRVPSVWLMGIWIVSFVVFMAGLFLLKARIGAKPGAHSPANKANGAVWQGIGMAIFFAFAALAVASWQTNDIYLISFAPSIILLFYGVGWTLGGAMSGQRWMTYTAYACFAAAVGVAFLIKSPAQYLAYAGCLFALATVPGILLMRREPSDIV